MNKKSSTMRRTIEDELGIKPVGDLNHHSTFAIYGRAGSGKTTLASTFPTPILLLDIRDRGTDSIQDVKNIFVKQIEHTDDLEDIYHYLIGNPAKFKTVVFDTITELQRLVMKRIVSEKPSKKNRKVDEARIGDWGTMSQRDWGDVAAEMNAYISEFRDLPMNVVYLAQERVRENDGEEDEQITPEVGSAVMPSVKTTLNAAVNIVGNTFVRMNRVVKEIKGKKKVIEKPSYCLRIGPNPVYDTKFRKPRSIILPGYIEDPTYEELMAIVKGE